MALRPSFVEDAAYPRVALFVFEGVLIAALGVVLQLVGGVVSGTLVSLGRIALVVGGVTAVLGAVGYAAVAYAVRSADE